jgi:hypothetical protein
MLAAAGGPEPELLVQLRIAERTLAPIPVAGVEQPFQPRSLHFDRVSVDVDGERATLVSTLDARGRIGPVEVSSLGRERLHFLRQAGGWQLEGVLAPALSAALSTLSLRARLLGGRPSTGVDAGGRRRTEQVNDPPRPHPRYRRTPLGAPGLYLLVLDGAVALTEEALLHRLERPPEARPDGSASSTGGRGFVFEGGVL